MKSYVMFSAMMALATSIGFISGSYFEKYNQKETISAYNLQNQKNLSVLNYYFIVKNTALVVEDLSSSASEEEIKILRKKWIERLKSDVGVFQNAFIESKRAGINNSVLNIYESEARKLDEQYDLEIFPKDSAITSR